MQTKASYRLLKWTMLLGTVASMATACVVTSGDDDDDDNSAGEGGTSSVAGKTSTGGAGTTSTAGKTSGGSSTAGSSAGGMGGSDAEEIGVCMGTDNPEPSSLPSCNPPGNDAADACLKCVRNNCCTEYKTCFGDEPRTACGWGPNPADGFAGQYECILACYDEEIVKSAKDFEDIIADCSGQCVQQCDADNVIMDSTNALVGCAVDSCVDECFPAP